jgi:flagellar protein FlaG
MFIKSITSEPIDNIGKYSRKTEPVDQIGAAQSQSLPRAQARSQPDETSRELKWDEISEIVDRLNSGVKDMHERLSFSVHEKTQRIVVKIVNTDTNEVIREIPSKDAIKLLEHIQDFLGMVIDESR